MRFVLLRRPPTHSTTRIRIEEILRIRRREYLGLIHTHAAATGAPLEDNMHSHLEDDPDDRAQTRSARPTTHLERAELEVEPIIELAPLLAADNVVPVAHRDPPTTHPTPARHRTRMARAAAAPKGAHFAPAAALEVDEHAKPRVLTVGELQQLERRVEDVAECADRAHNRLELGSSVEDNDARCSSRAQPPQRPHWRSTMPHGLSRCGQV